LVSTRNLKTEDDHRSQLLFLIEPEETSGSKTVSWKLWDREELSDKSKEAIHKAMSTIHYVADEVNSTIQKIDKKNKPDNIWIEFGLRFNGNLDIVIAKVGMESNIAVELTWNKSGKK
jgi:hypothetical protein